jgi:uncharacterized Fe-S cluster protein YjdI
MSEHLSSQHTIFVPPFHHSPCGKTSQQPQFRSERCASKHNPPVCSHSDSCVMRTRIHLALRKTTDPVIVSIQNSCTPGALTFTGKRSCQRKSVQTSVHSRTFMLVGIRGYWRYFCHNLRASTASNTLLLSAAYKQDSVHSKQDRPSQGKTPLTRSFDLVLDHSPSSTFAVSGMLQSTTLLSAP